MKKINIFVTIITLIFMNTAPLAIYAADEEVIDTRTGWEKTVDFVSKVTDFVGESIAQLVNKFFYGIGEFVLVTICPTCTEASSRVQSGDFPDQMKYGLLGIAETQVTAMFQSSPDIDVVAHLSEEWIPGYKESKSVYASGYDDISNTGISEIWSFTRNIAYLGFVIIMIVVGFMIMFRNKLGGQTLVTLGNTLPRIVVSLVLVTFSFAIAGIIIDIAGVMMSVIKSLLGSGIPVHDIGALTWEGGAKIGSVFGGVAGAAGLASIVIPITAPILGTVGIISLIGGIIISGAAFMGAIKLWLALVKSYLALLLNVIVAPFSIMFGSMPGNDASTINLFKSILRNALVFPIAFAIVNLPFFLDNNGIIIEFPETLTGEQASVLKLGPIIMAIAKLIALYAAAQAPALAQAIVPATASKSGADAAGAIKAGFSKVPFIGGMFGGK